MARIFITGASGFVGRALGERYRSEGAQVAGVDLVAEPGRRIVAGDVTVDGDWKAAIRKGDIVIHTAALVSNDGTRDEFWRRNVLATWQVLNAAIAAGASRFVHFSSIRAFSDFEFPDGVTEDHPVRWNGRGYVDSKIASEHVVLQAAALGRIPTTIIRPADIYGPRSRPWTILPFEGIRENRFIITDGVFSPVFIDNLLDGILLAASSDAAIGHIFTLSDGIGITNAEFFHYYSELLGIPDPPSFPIEEARARATALGEEDERHGRTSLMSVQMMEYLTRPGTYSIESAQTVLGYAPKVSLDEGMAVNTQWLRDSGYTS